LKKTNLPNIDLELYSEKLDNGLEIYIIPQKNIGNIHVTFTTRFGGKDIEFSSNHDKKITTVPHGIAHFLEHEMFNKSEDAVNPTVYFDSNGTYYNASTDHFCTKYIFSGPNDLDGNLNVLLDYVQKPYFTKENVAKEHGIIEQEIDMIDDYPYTKLIDKTFYNLFLKHPAQVSVIGTKKSISNINEDNLMKCYKTFYHPSNMFVVVTGNVKPDEVVNIIKENQKNKSFTKKHKINWKKHNEPIKVRKEKETITGNVSIPKICVSYKIDINKFKDIDLKKLVRTIALYFETKIGVLSEAASTLLENQAIGSYFDILVKRYDDKLVICIIAETNKSDEVEETVINVINDKKIFNEDLELIKKSLISQVIYMSDSEISLNNKIVNDIIHFNKIYEDEISLIKEITGEEMRKIIECIDFNNKVIVVLEPNK